MIKAKFCSNYIYIAV